MAKSYDKMTKFELRTVLAARDAEIIELRAEASRAQSPVLRGPSREEFHRRCKIRKAASAKYFAAHPGLRSAPMADILEWAARHG